MNRVSRPCARLTQRRPACRSVWIAGVCGMPLVLGGCLITGDTQTMTYGEYVSRSAFEQIEIGQSTQLVVLGLLGEPTSKAEGEGGREVWRWAYNTRKLSDSAVFLLWNFENSREQRGVTYVEFNGGVVTSKWRE